MRALAILIALTLSLVQATVARSAAEHQHEHGAAAGLTLNDGKKWIADKHTADSVAGMKSTVGKVSGKTAAASIADLHLVGEQLQEQLQTLIRGCTMTGPAHEQLHTWISLLAPEIQELNKTEQPETARAAVEKISGLLASFDEHFETGPQPK